MVTRLLVTALLVGITAGTVGCHIPAAAIGLPVAHNLPPAQRIAEAGPGVGGPGPGVLMPQMPPHMAQRPAPSVQVMFAKPEGMQVRWDVVQIGTFDSDPLIVPGRHNFPQGGIFRLKITNIEGREGVELYPSLEVAPTTPRTGAYLAHNAVPVQFTEEDFDQVLSGNFVTKVIYLPDPEFQELALAGVETLVSTRLDPGVDPIVEADRRGAILAIIRLGNKDEEMPGFAPAGAGAGVAPAGYFNGFAGGMPLPMAPLPHQAGGVAPPYISGATAPPYGMPYVGTPIGLPGPPHIPLGGPAGLQRHLTRNHTHRWIPGPTTDLRTHIQQSPGMSYPAPPDQIYLKEHTKHPTHFNRQPPSNMKIGGYPHLGGRHRAGCNCPQCVSGR